MHRIDRLSSPRLWLAVAVAAVLVGASLALGFHEFRERAVVEQEVGARAARMSELATRHVEQVLASLESVAGIAVDSLEQTWAPAPGVALESATLLTGLASAVPGIVDIAVLDAGGERVFQASHRIQVVSAVSPALAEVHDRHRTAPGSEIALFGPRQAGDGRLLATRRMDSVTGEFLGVVLLWFDVVGLVRMPELESGVAIRVSMPDGEVLAVAGPGPWDGAAVGVGAGWARGQDPAGDTDLMIVRRQLANGVLVDVAGDLGQALADWRRSAMALMGWFGLSLLPLAAIVWLLLREIRHRDAERRLADDARRVELETTRGEVRRLALVAQHTRSAVIITGVDEIIVWVNPAFTAITGYAVEEARGRHCGHLLQGADSDPAVRARMRAGLDSGEGFSVEIVNYAKDGRRYWAQIDCAPARAADGRIDNYVAIVSDVTARKEQEALLAAALQGEREANALQRRFVSMASHEFRTPLAIIDGAAQRLVAGHVGEDLKARSRIERIRDAVTRMTEMIDRTLSSARLDEGRIGFEPARMDLAALLRELVGRQRELSPGFEIVLAIDPDPLSLTADRRLMEQIVTNLLSNAVKYSGQSRRIEIEARATATGVELVVADRGVGIPADEIDRLFTRYFRARTAMGIPGTGIGLHLVRELVEMHGGTVAVRSRPGIGTRFIIHLPAAGNGVATLTPAA